jgi:hypothetical protein
MSRLCLRLSHSNAHGRLLLLWVYKPSVHADNWGGGGGAQHPPISYVILVLIDTERRQLVHSTL